MLNDSMRELLAVAFPREHRLAPHQRVWLWAAFRHLYLWMEAARGGAKSYGAAMLVLLLAVLRPTRIVVVGSRFRHAKYLYEFLERLIQLSPFLQAEVADSGKAADYWDVKFKNGSLIRCLPASGFSVHGARADWLIFTEFAGVSSEFYASSVIPFAFTGEHEAHMVWETAAGSVGDFAYQERKRVATAAQQGHDFALIGVTGKDLVAGGFPFRMKIAEQLREISEGAYLQMVENQWRQYAEHLYTWASLNREDLRTAHIRLRGEEGKRYVAGIDVAGRSLKGKGNDSALVIVEFTETTSPAFVFAKVWNSITYDRQAEEMLLILNRFGVERISLDMQTLGDALYQQFLSRGVISDEEGPGVPGERIIRRAPHSNETIHKMHLLLSDLFLRDGAIQTPEEPEAENLVPGYDAVRMMLQQLADLDVEERDGKMHFKKRPGHRLDLAYAGGYAIDAWREIVKVEEEDEFDWDEWHRTHIGIVGVGTPND